MIFSIWNNSIGGGSVMNIKPEALIKCLSSHDKRELTDINELTDAGSRASWGAYKFTLNSCPPPCLYYAF